MTNFHCRRGLIGGLLISMLGGTAALGQHKILRSQTAPSIHRQVNEMALDVVVTNAQGKIIPGVRASQVEIRENGRLVPVKSFRALNAPMGAAPSLAAVAKANAGAPVITAAQSAGGNLITAVFDAIAGEPAILANQGMRHFIRHDLQPGDEMAVVRLEHGLIVLQPYTNNQNLLLQAVREATLAPPRDLIPYARRSAAMYQNYLITLQALNANTGAFGAPSPGLESSVHFLMALQNLTQSQVNMQTETRSWATLPYLRQLVHALGQAPGRKAVLYFTQSLTVNSNTSYIYRQIMRQSRVHAVSFYVVDPSGLNGTQFTNTGMDSADSVTPGNAIQTGDPLSRTQSQLSLAAAVSQSQGNSPEGRVTSMQAHAFDRIQDARYVSTIPVLRGLADTTGGMLVADTNNLAMGLDKIGRNLAVHYELTFVPAGSAAPNLSALKLTIAGHPDWRVLAQPYNIASAASAHPVVSTPLPLEARALFFPENPVTPTVLWMQRLTSHGLHAPANASWRDTLEVTNAQGQVVTQKSHVWPATRRPSLWMPMLQLAPGIYRVQSQLQAGTQPARQQSWPLTVPASAPAGPRLSSVVVVRQLLSQPSQPRPAWKRLSFHGMRIVPHAGVASFAQRGKAIGFYLMAYVPHAAVAPQMTLTVYQHGVPVSGTAVPLEPPDAQGRIPVLVTLPENSFYPGVNTLRFTLHSGEMEVHRRVQIVIQANHKS